MKDNITNSTPIIDGLSADYDIAMMFFLSPCHAFNDRDAAWSFKGKKDNADSVLFIHGRNDYFSS